jgi:hypothetical protein
MNSSEAAVNPALYEKYSYPTFHLLSSYRPLIQRGVSADLADRHCAVILDPSLLLLCISIKTVRNKDMEVKFPASCE